MKIIKKYALLVVFAVFVLGFSVADLIKPQRAFSELENRYLTSMPEPTWKTFLNGTFTSKFETFCNDQFILRDSWVSLKSVTESALGKQENNGIVYGKDGYLFEKRLTLKGSNWDKNAQALKTFADKYGDRLTVGIIPNSYAVLTDQVPTGLGNIDQGTEIQKLYDSLGVKTLDLLSALREHSQEYLYYRTDHHWTTLGAYYGYEAFCESAGINSMDLDYISSTIVNDFYGTYYSKAKLRTAKSDEITWFDVPVGSVTIDGGQADGLYSKDQWAKRDKYAAFLHGNNGMTVITPPDGKTNGKKLLMIKDSYGNSFAPFLAGNYDQVTIVDLRHYLSKLSVLLEKNQFDEVLILYSFQNFADDNYMARLNF